MTPEVELTVPVLIKAAIAFSLYLVLNLEGEFKQ